MKLKTVIKKIIKLTRKKEIIPIQKNIDSCDLLKNKIAVIIGGSGGIGLAIAKSFSECGCKIVLCGTNPDKLNKAISSFDCNENVRSMIFDVTDIDSVKQKVADATAVFGGVDILVNTAGVHTENVDFFTMTSEEYDRVMNVNIKGPYFVCREFVNYMINNRQQGVKKHILMVSSSRGFEPAWSPYGISKWALNGLTQGLAQKLLGYGIIVNAIAPGSTATELIGIKEGDSIGADENGLGRYIMPVEVANVAKLLVSDAGDMIVGETIRVSGGRGVFDIR